MSEAIRRVWLEMLGVPYDSNRALSKDFIKYRAGLFDTWKLLSATDKPSDDAIRRRIIESIEHNGLHCAQEEEEEDYTQLLDPIIV